MATKKSVSKKPVSQKPVEKSRIIKAAEKVGDMAGTAVGKKNKLVKKAKLAIDSAREKVHELRVKTIPAEKEIIKKKVQQVKKEAAKTVAAAKDSFKKAVKRAQ